MDIVRETGHKLKFSGKATVITDKNWGPKSPIKITAKTKEAIFKKEDSDIKITVRVSCFLYAEVIYIRIHSPINSNKTTYEGYASEKDVNDNNVQWQESTGSPPSEAYPAIRAAIARAMTPLHEINKPFYAKEEKT